MSLSDIDLFDLDRYQVGVPHEDYARLRAQAPVYFHPDPQTPGFWAVTRHADVVHISRNPELFSSAARTAMTGEYDGDALFKQQLIMLNMDEPEHSRLRSLVNRGFTPRMIARLEDRIAATCAAIVDTAVAQSVAEGAVEFVTAVSAPLPLAAIADLMGVPESHHKQLFEWSNRMIGFDDPEFRTTPEDGELAAMEIVGYAHELGAEKRACPVDDIVTKLISPDASGNQLSELEFDMFFILLAVAGNETTRNAISGGMLALIEHPDQWARLRADPALHATAADEIVRWVSPVMDFRRTVLADTQIGEQQVRKGDKVVIFYASANRDEAVFPEPDRFDVGRSPNPHIGFGGGGPHFCLGSHLAKLEIQVMLRTLVERVERVELAGDVRRLRSNFINGIKEMPVRLVPASR
ncbi:MAG: cytochrome P450 [Mycobacteriales bacterium]